MSKLFRRQYVIRNSEGKVIGEVKQRENENLQRYFERGTSIFDMPDLNFDVEDHVSGLKYVFTRTSGLGQANAMFVENERGTSIATTQWVLAFAWATYSIEARGEDLGYTIKRPFWRPLNLDILDAFEDCVGSMQVGWSGLGGFLTGGSLFRLQVDGGQVSGDVKWGLLAAALLVDWESETRR